MKLSWKDIEAKALGFSKKWQHATDEFAEAQSFLNDFFDVFGVDRKRVALFEKKVPMGKTRSGYIDLLWKGVILIEMKSRGKSLEKAYTQAKDYAFNLEDEELPEYIMVSDFDNIKLYRVTTEQEWKFKTNQFRKNVKLFADLAGYKAAVEIPGDEHVDIKAAEKMAKLHDILKSHGYEGHHLEVYLVRLLFCLFADDTGIFEKNIFFDYINTSKEDGSDLSFRLARLFEVLDTPHEERAKQTMLSDELKRFEYINGSLFTERLPFADFDSEMRKILLDCSTVDWGYISPAIFGAMFQGVMNPEERRELGAHYTSEENILKVIKPLFIDELWEEFERIKGNSKQLNQFHEKISKLKFLDPACGCGNFLIITYKELRKLELAVLKMLIDTGGQLAFDFKLADQCKVNVNQFYGIEYEEFPAQIAQVGMWLMDHQMNNLVAEHFGLYYARLPLRQSATIIQGNALSIDWEEIVPKYELSYIMGNPPFAGASMMNKNQKDEIFQVFSGIKSAGKLDYVSAWFLRASQYIEGTMIKVGFVATNSICQGEQVGILWGELMDHHKITINFAYKTFVWNNEAKGKAAVHCVIIGFSQVSNKKKYIFDGDEVISASNINPYLIDAANIIIKTRQKPISNVPEMIRGNQPTEGGNLIIEGNELEDFLNKEPNAKPYIKKLIGSAEFINNTNRYCLWLVGVNPKALKSMPFVMERIQKVKEMREQSSFEGTRKLAMTPTTFRETNNPDNYIVIPRVSSERRKYIPMGFLNADTIATDAVHIIPNATLYHFGILTSKVHMSWMRNVAGRLKSDYRYSKDIVYNNFPWPDVTEQQKEAIEQAAQGVLDARLLYSDSSLADLYDPLAMPLELVKAHNKLDRAVVAAYGGKGFTNEADRVADLMERYLELTKLKL